MKQKFIITIDSVEDIGVGQIGAPVMDALNLTSIQVDKVAQPEVALSETLYTYQWHCSDCGGWHSEKFFTCPNANE